MLLLKGFCEDKMVSSVLTMTQCAPLICNPESFPLLGRVAAPHLAELTAPRRPSKSISSRRPALLTQQARLKKKKIPAILISL